MQYFTTETDSSGRIKTPGTIDHVKEISGIVNSISSNMTPAPGRIEGELVAYRNISKTSIQVSEFTIQPDEGIILEWRSKNWGKAGSIPALSFYDAPPVPDTTPPSSGSITSSAILDHSFTLAINGVVDNYKLHNQPYSFSTNNGNTWSEWQTSNVYNVAGVSAKTTYTCKARSRDTSGNVSTTSTISVTTLDEIPTWGTLYSEDFNGADGSLSGRTLTSNNTTWVTPLYTTSSNMNYMSVSSGVVKNNGFGRLNVPHSRFIVEFDMYSVSFQDSFSFWFNVMGPPEKNPANGVIMGPGESYKFNISNANGFRIYKRVVNTDGVATDTLLNTINSPNSNLQLNKKQSYKVTFNSGTIEVFGDSGLSGGSFTIPNYVYNPDSYIFVNTVLNAAGQYFDNFRLRAE